MKFDDLKSSFEPAPQGVYTGTLVWLIDNGQQPSKFGSSRQTSLRWLLDGVETETGDPCIVFQTIWNTTLRSKAFRDVVKGLMGNEPLAGRSLSELVGRSARVTIVHNEGESQTYANIEGIKPLKPGTPRPRTPEDTCYLSLSPEEYSAETLSILPERMQEKIRGSSTYKETLAVLANKGKPAAAIINDDFPENLGGAAA